MQIPRTLSMFFSALSFNYQFQNKNQRPENQRPENQEPKNTKVKNEFACRVWATVHNNCLHFKVKILIEISLYIFFNYVIVLKIIRIKYA